MAAAAYFVDGGPRLGEAGSGEGVNAISLSSAAPSSELSNEQKNAPMGALL